MAELINCVECNGQISSAASKCPHCKSECPQGVRCFLCEQMMKNSEATRARVPDRYSQVTGSGHVHLGRCHDSIFYDTTRCPVCNKQVTFSNNSGSASWFTCTNCGHHIFTKRCDICGYHLFENNAVKITKYSHAHPVCASAKGPSKYYNPKKGQQEALIPCLIIFGIMGGICGIIVGAVKGHPGGGLLGGLFIGAAIGYLWSFLALLN